MRSVSHRGPIHLGLDVHKDTISVGILRWDQESPDVDRIFHDEASVRRLLDRFPDRRGLRVCYEAWPTGFELARLLASLGVSCQVIAPSLIPRAGGDRVKTDRRDCARLARLHRAGELVAIRVPSPAEEAVRDLCRARADLVEDRRRARQRLGKFLLRHGRVYRAGAAWTARHEAWTRGAAVHRAGAGVHVRPLPGGAQRPGRRTGRDRDTRSGSLSSQAAFASSSTVAVKAG